MHKRIQSNASAITPAALRVMDAAAYLGVGRSKIFDLLKDGELTQLKIDRCLLIPRASLDALLARASTRNSLPKAG